MHTFSIPGGIASDTQSSQDSNSTQHGDKNEFNVNTQVCTATWL